MKTAQKFFLSSILLLGSQVVFGMKKEKLDEAQIESLMYEADRAEIQAIALRLRKSESEVRKIARLDVSKIKKLSYSEEANFTEYVAVLDNEDIIGAILFKKGSMAGKYDCTYELASQSIEIPMNSNVYDRLHDEYELRMASSKLEKTGGGR